MSAMKKIVMNLYGEGARVDVLDSNEDVIECYNAMVDDEYFDIEVDGKKYSYDDFGGCIRSGEWPDDIYDYGEEKFIDEAYEKFKNRDTPCLALPLTNEGCFLADECLEGVESILVAQTKVSASVTIEICEDEEFDPKKLHFMRNCFVFPDSEMDVNCGVVYNGEQYAIELDIESEKEISVETVWEA